MPLFDCVFPLMYCNGIAARGVCGMNKFFMFFKDI